MRKSVRYLLHFLLVVFITLVAANLNLIGYGISQLKGQLHIINNTIPVDEALKSKNLNDDQKRKLLLIREIKKFAVDSLALNPSENYTTFYDQHNKPVLWIVTACPPYQLKSYQWRFPVIGYVSYKGFFEKEKGIPNFLKLKKQGYDVDLSPVSAWSTLGFFKDPVLSNFLKRDDGRIAELIIHELTHGTIYNASSVDYNENLATFIGEQGAVRFLQFKFGYDSKQLSDYMHYKTDEERYAEYMAKGSVRLDSLYKSFTDDMTVRIKDSLKKSVITSIMQQLDTIQFYNRARYYFDFNKMPLPNNTDFMINNTYRGMQRGFENKLNGLHGDLRKFIAVQKNS